MVNLLKESGIRFEENVHLENYCTIKCDLIAKLIVFPKNVSQIKKIIKLCVENDFKYFVIGNGSNLLFVNDNFVFIKLWGFNLIKQNGNELICESCAKINDICLFARNAGLGAIEGLFLIPAQIGGATVMNARAFGCEMKNVVKSVKCLNKDGKIVFFNNVQCDFAYKHSIFQNSNFIITQVILKLKPKRKFAIAKKMEIIRKKRTETQPKGLSVGCVFKNKRNVIAGKLIQDCGFAGFVFKGFKVSEKHCNFILNLGCGKSFDLIKLIEKIKSKVYNKFKVVLDNEIILVGVK